MKISMSYNELNKKKYILIFLINIAFNDCIVVLHHFKPIKNHNIIFDDFVSMRTGYKLDIEQNDFHNNDAFGIP